MKRNDYLCLTTKRKRYENFRKQRKRKKQAFKAI